MMTTQAAKRITPKQLAKEMVLTALLGRMHELTTEVDDRIDGDDECRGIDADEVSRHIAKYLRRLVDYIER